jgi:hypothetical protein
MISQTKKRTLEDLDINHSGFAWTDRHAQVSFVLVQEGGVEEVLSDDVVVNDNTIYCAASKDAIHGLSGNDALNGGAGPITDSDGQGSIQIDGGLGDDSTPEKNQRRMLFVLEREQEQKSQVTDRKTAMCQGALKAAGSHYRIRSCLRPFLSDCRVIRYKRSSAHPVQCAQTQQAYGWCGRGRPDARSGVTR